jgi:hypothetical protein
MKFLQNRVIAVLLAALVIVGLGAGGAVAGSLITSRDIKNESVRGVDLKDNSIGRRHIRLMGIGPSDLGGRLLARLNSANQRSQENEDAVQHLQRSAFELELVTDGPYTNTWTGDEGASLQTAVVECDPGSVAVGGGFSGQGGADDTGTEAYDSLQVVASYPYFTGEYEPVNERGSFTPNAWVVKGFNLGTADLLVRPWVTCAHD